MGRRIIISRFQILQPEVRIIVIGRPKLLLDRSNSDKDGECGLVFFRLWSVPGKR